jgi:hypothetical protein
VWAGKYLGDAAVKALPKAQQPSLMPGYNVFGDGMFFGEGMLKETLAPVSCVSPSLSTLWLQLSLFPSICHNPPHAERAARESLSTRTLSLSCLVPFWWHVL